MNDVFPCAYRFLLFQGAYRFLFSQVPIVSYFSQVPIVSWFDDPSDRELLELMPFFENLARIDDVCTFLSNANLPNGCITFAVSNIEEDVDNVSSAAVPSVTSPLMSSNPVTAVAQVS